MTLDYQQVREQIKKLGESAPQRAKHLRELRELALELLKNNAHDLEALRDKVQRIARNYDPNLRCARPAWGPGGVAEPLDGHFSPPSPPEKATVLAADGSQIAPDRHAAVNYGLINVGAIQMHLESPQAPTTTVHSQLFYDEQLYTEAGVIEETGGMTDARLALMRDLNERKRLAEIAEQVAAPVISFTDGPMELWGAKDLESAAQFQQSLAEYIGVLKRLCRLKVATAGYVDKPAANLVVRLLEIASLPEDQSEEVKKYNPLRGVMDLELFRRLLEPGERSALFAIQSRSAGQYRDELALHFFYLNVGRPGHPWTARVEIPAWVAGDREMLDNLHSVLVQQCRIMGSRPYPYLLHRAHEAAVVSQEEKEQITQMIALELRSRGVEVGEVSYKQSAKDLQGRTSYKR
jgi:hypothetical protein